MTTRIVYSAKDLAGCCGLYCGLCSKYQSKAPSRCLGCRVGEQHSWCSIWNCCVKKHGYEMCTECSEVFNCKIFQRRKVAEWIPAFENLRQIQKVGLEIWLKEQKQRLELVEELLEKYNEGRSMSFYCKVCARMPVDMINRVVKEAEELFACEKIDKSDIKSKAKIVKAVFTGCAVEADINLDQ